MRRGRGSLMATTVEKIMKASAEVGFGEKKGARDIQ